MFGNNVSHDCKTNLKIKRTTIKIPRYITSDIAGTEIVDPGKIPQRI